jgi:hypothetical protein
MLISAVKDYKKNIVLEIVYYTFWKLKKVLFLMQNLVFLSTFSSLTSASGALVKKTF